MASTDDSSSSATALENGHLQPPNSINNNTTTEKPPPNRHRVPPLIWITQNVTFSWFTATQSTGGIAVLLSLSPKTFPGLQTIGLIIFILNLVLFPLFTAGLAYRWTADPQAMRASFTRPPECYFFGSFWLTLATMLLNAQRYGTPHCGPWLVTALRVSFWVYSGATLLTAVLHVVVLCKYTPIRAIEFASPMIILILSAMISGTLAAGIAPDQPPAHRLPIMVAGVAFQGLGWVVCVIFLTLTFANLLERGWPAAALRPGLFIITGTSGFTIVALIGIARACPKEYGYFKEHPLAAEVLLIVATWVGVFLWLFSFWGFGVAFFINVLEMFVKKDGKWRFTLVFNNTAWALIFPNVGWAISTIYLGQEFQSEGILWVSVAMIILLTAFWLLNLCMMAKAIVMSMFVDSRIKLS